MECHRLPKKNSFSQADAFCCLCEIPPGHRINSKKVSKLPAHHEKELGSDLTALASAVMGDSNKTKVPTICIPHGIITNGGFCFLLSSYVMTTRESCFRILNPSRGLSLAKKRAA